MAILMVLALFKAHRSLPLADRLNSRSMLSLTITGILAIMKMFEIECFTEFCDHESRYLYNTLAVSTVGISWTVQLLCSLSILSAVPSRRGYDPDYACLSRSASPPPRPRQKRWGGKRMYAGHMLGRSSRARQARRLSLRYSAMTPPATPPNAAWRARHARCRRYRTGTPAGGNHTKSRCGRSPNPHNTASACPVLPLCRFGNESAPLDTACTNQMRNSSAGFSEARSDDTKVLFGSRTCKAESKDTFDTVPDVLYVPGMIVPAL
jgi:hypothetical protein